MDQFSIILPCNKAENLANYTVALPLPVTLTGSWEVGLTELSFTNSWNNFVANQSVDLLYYENNKMQINKNREANVPTGIYTKADLVEKIKKAKAKHLRIEYTRSGSNTYFKHRKLSDTPDIKINGNVISLQPGIFDDNNEYLFIRPGPKLCNALGIDYETIMGYAKKVFADYAKNPKIAYKAIEFRSTEKPFDNITSFNVYSSACQNRIVGTLLKPLLRIVRIPKHMPFWEQFTVSYDNPQYIRLRENQFDKIWIKIKESVKMYDAEDEKNYIPFKFGETVATLNFRRISQYKVPSELTPPETFE